MLSTVALESRLVLAELDRLMVPAPLGHHLVSRIDEEGEVLEVIRDVSSLVPDHAVELVMAGRGIELQELVLDRAGIWPAAKVVGHEGATERVATEGLAELWMEAVDLAVEDPEDADDICQGLEAESILSVSDMDVETAGSVDHGANLGIKQVRNLLGLVESRACSWKDWRHDLDAVVSELVVRQVGQLPGIPVNSTWETDRSVVLVPPALRNLGAPAWVH